MSRWSVRRANGAFPILLSLFTVACLPLSDSSATLRAADLAGFPSLVTHSYGGDDCCTENGDDCGEDDDCRSFGPCYCQPRGTLFQWSYGTSFGGGADLDEPLVTDRPDFTESSVTVGRGVVQLESGYTYLYDNEDGTSVKGHSYPEMLWRIGLLAEWLELRVGWNYLEETTTAAGVSSSVRGSDDLLLGLKFSLTPQECLLPEMALIAQMTVPSGTTGVSAEDVLPGVNWLYSWEVNDFLSIAGSTGAFRSLDDSGEFYVTITQSAVAGFSLTDHVGAYVEWFVLAPSGAVTASTEHFLNGGFTLLVNNDIQFDIRAGVGLNSAAADYFVGPGFALRF